MKRDALCREEREGVWRARRASSGRVRRLTEDGHEADPQHEPREDRADAKVGEARALVAEEADGDAGADERGRDDLVLHIRAGRSRRDADPKAHPARADARATA